MPRARTWEDIERAIHTAIVAASRLGASSVIWAYQDVGAPAETYIKLSLGGETGIGQDRIESIYDGSRPRGSEFRQVVRGLREMPLELEAFTSEVYGERAARRVLEVTRTRLQLDTIRAGLNRTSISMFDLSGSVGWIPDIPSARFRGRATLTIRCYVPVLDEAAEEAVGIIETVTGRVVPSGALLYSGMTGFPFTGVIGGS